MQKCKDAAMRLRLNIVLLYADGRGTAEIAATLGCAKSTALNVANRFLVGGEGGLIDRRCENGERKVDDDLLAALGDLLGKCPQDLGWARPTWTLELLVRTLEELTRTPAPLSPDSPFDDSRPSGSESYGVLRFPTRESAILPIPAQSHTVFAESDTFSRGRPRPLALRVVACFGDTTTC